MRLLILLLVIFSSNSFAQNLGTGLKDNDVVRFGLVVVNGLMEWPVPAGGLSVCIVGDKNPASSVSGGKRRTSNGCFQGGWDYTTEVVSYPASALGRGSIADVNGYVADSVAFNGKISAADINKAYMKAVVECQACKQFYLEVAQMEGWGMFDWLPIQQYKGIHDFNSTPSHMVIQDRAGKALGFDFFINFIDYEEE